MTAVHEAGVAPRFSVVIPTRDRPEGLARAVASVLDPSGPDVEVVVVDEASTPPAREALARWRDDPRIRVLRHDAPVGAAEARNAGIGVARGSWFAFLDDDDTFLPGKLARVASELEAVGDTIDVVYHDLRIDLVREGFEYRNAPDAGPITLERLLLKNLLGGPSMVVVRAAALARTGGFPDLPGSEDHGLYLELARAGARFHYLPEVLGTYERVSRRPGQGGPGARTLGLARADAAFTMIGERFAAELATWPAARLRERRRHFLTFRAYRQVMGGARLGAARDFARAFAAEPTPRNLLLLGAAASALASPAATLRLQGWFKQRARAIDRAT